MGWMSIPRVEATALPAWKGHRGRARVFGETAIADPLLDDDGDEACAEPDGMDDQG